MDEKQGTDLPPDHPFLSGMSGLTSMSIANLAMGGSWVDLVLDAYFEILLASDDAATRKIVAASADALKPINPMLADVLDDLKNQPTPLNPDAIFNGKKWKRLEAAVTETIGDYSPAINKIITEGQTSAVAIANDAMDQAWTAMALDMNDPAMAARWRKMPINAYADMVGRLQTGAPLSDLLDSLPDATNREFRTQLLRGIALGENADVIGNRVAKASGLPGYRARSISRTAILNTYRETSRRNYLNNPAVIDGWFWQSAQNSRTCMACLMRDGTLYPTDEKMPAHANCRCRMRPRLRNGENTLRETGAEWFDRQDDLTKLKMLGPAAHKAWKQGKFELRDLAGFVVDPTWGAFSTRRPLTETLSFVQAGRPFHPGDFPPGWATPLDPVVLEQGANAAFAQLDHAKKILADTPPAPIGFEDFNTCMGH